MNQRKQIGYVCSPLRGDMEANMERARRYSHFVYELGYIPVAPHLLFTQFMDDDVEEERAAAIQMDLDLVAMSGCLFVFGWPSQGMSEEIGFARENGVPMRFFDADMNEIQNAAMHGNTVLMRLAEDDDIDELYELAKLVRDDMDNPDHFSLDDGFLSDARDMIGERGFAVKAVDVNGDIVGFVLFDVDVPEDDEALLAIDMDGIVSDCVRMHHIVVHPDCQVSGLAYGMVSHAFSKIADEHPEKRWCVVTTHEDNVKARGLMSKAGHSPVKVASLYGGKPRMVHRAELGDAE